MHQHHFGETGGVSESEYFGVVETSKYMQELRRKFESLEENPRTQEAYIRARIEFQQGLPPYFPYNASFDLIKRCQRSLPTSPEKEYARDFRSEVFKCLSNITPQPLREENVLFYTACSDVEIKGHHLNTPLDQWHGVDAFLEITLPDGWHTVITIDGSVDPNKGERKTKSDLITIWPEDLDSRLNPDLFNDFVKSEARKAVEFLSHQRTLKAVA